MVSLYHPDSGCDFSVSSFALFLLLMALSLPVVGCGSSPINSNSSNPPGGDSPGIPAQYHTNFPLAENPISEGGKWINGGIGVDWAKVQTTPGFSFGTESGSGGYDDSIAVLTGNWNADQMAQATVRTVNQDSSIFEEVELRLRTAIAPHSITGYEVNFRCTSDGSQYVQIVRWNGPLSDFSYINTAVGPGLRNGDLVKATIVGHTISAYINGTLVLQGTDSTYATGNPGIGFYLQGSSGVNGDYGFTQFTAQAPPDS